MELSEGAQPAASAQERLLREVFRFAQILHGADNVAKDAIAAKREDGRRASCGSIMATPFQRPGSTVGFGHRRPCRLREALDELQHLGIRPTANPPNPLLAIIASRAG